ncbi:hypothetical protein LIER_17007 [Lithospermum erythrorhizon]|uniref:Secreted protein n=1 Tax=Lithospermum erythrorhizon TaxID=34254 RepID=A0AAV3QD49_LITER
MWWIVTSCALRCSCSKFEFGVKDFTTNLRGSEDPKARATRLLGRKTRATTATPGQAGLPAEFKHINKRRKRNLQGFP